MLSVLATGQMNISSRLICQFSVLLLMLRNLQMCRLEVFMASCYSFAAVFLAEIASPSLPYLGQKTYLQREAIASLRYCCSRQSKKATFNCSFWKIPLLKEHSPAPEQAPTLLCAVQLWPLLAIPGEILAPMISTFWANRSALQYFFARQHKLLAFKTKTLSRQHQCRIRPTAIDVVSISILHCVEKTGLLVLLM